MTVYFSSTSFLRIHDYNTADGSKNGYTDTETSINSYTFAVIPGHTYVMSTTGKTNNMFYAGYKYIVDKEVSVPVKFNNVVFLHQDYIFDYIEDKKGYRDRYGKADTSKD